MNRDLTTGKADKVLVMFCLPLFASVIFQQLYNIADSLIAGRFLGEYGLAAVGNSYEITLVLLAFAFGCNIGCSVLTSRYFGAKDYGKMKTTVLTSVISTAAVCVFLMAVSLVFAGPLLRLIKTPDSLMDDSLVYLNIYVYGLPFVFFYNIATGIFTALGDSVTPFCFLAVSSVSNVLMDILFVHNFSMGVAGVAWATFICQGVSCILSLIVVYLRLKKIKCDDKFRIFDRYIFGQFVKIAIPSTIQQSFVSIGNVIIQGLINGFGEGVMAGYSAAVKLNNLVIVSITTIGNGISNYASQNIGAGRHDRIKDGMTAGIKLVWIILVPVFILYMFFPGMLLHIFLEEPSADALSSGMMYLRVLAPFYFVVGCKLVSDGIIRGAGMMKIFMVDTFTDLILRVVLSIILSKTALGWLGIWISWPVGWISGTVISVIFCLKFIRHKEIAEKL